MNARSFTTAGVLALALLTTTAGTASAASPQPIKNLCLNGGYVGYVDPATGKPFTSEKACVRVASRDKQLTLVQVTPVVTLTPVFRPDWGIYEVTVEVQAAPGPEGRQLVLELATGDYVDNNRVVYLNAAGYGKTTIGVAPNTELTVSYQGTVIGRVTPDPVVAPVQQPAVTYTDLPGASGSTYRGAFDFSGFPANTYVSWYSNYVDGGTTNSYVLTDANGTAHHEFYWPCYGTVSYLVDITAYLTDDPSTRFTTLLPKPAGCGDRPVA